MVNLNIQSHETYQIEVVSHEKADELYKFLKEFWVLREYQDLTVERVEHLRQGYRVSMLPPHLKVLRDILVKLYHEKSGDEPFSILELGCANGSALHFLKLENLSNVEFVGIEPWDVFIEDFRNHFPDQTIIKGTADQFAESGFPELANRKFDLCIVSLVLYLLHPDVARACVRNASGICDRIFIHDYIVNMTGGISSTYPVVFHYYPGGRQAYFAHVHQAYLDESGYDITGLFEVPHQDGKRGHGLIVGHHRRLGDRPEDG